MNPVLLQQQQAAILPPAPAPPTGPALRLGQILELGAANSYTTDQGTHAPFPASDIFAPEGTPIYAPCDGESWPKLYQFGGYTTVIKETDRERYHYLAHGQVPFVAGPVRAGQQIGRVGSTGTGPGGYTASGGTAPHVHYAIAPDSHFRRGYRGGSGTEFIPSWVWGR